MNPQTHHTSMASNMKITTMLHMILTNNTHLWHIPLAQVVLLAASVASKRNWLGLIRHAIQDKERQDVVDGM